MGEQWSDMECIKLYIFEIFPYLGVQDGSSN